VKTKLATELVRMYQEVVHYLPCSISNTRVRGWESVKCFPWGFVKMRSWETITVSDLFALVATVKAFQAHPEGVIEGEMIHDRKTLTATVGLKQFMENYLGHHNEAYLVESLERLSSFQVFFHSNNGHIRDERYLLGFDIIPYEQGAKGVRLILSKIFYEYCIKSGLTVNFDTLKGLSGNVSRVLFVYLSGQANRSFYQPTLETAIGLTGSPRDNRKALVRAFKCLKKAGAVKDYNAVKTEKGYRFSWK
jgi:hypothetical protein